jgi:hypothetical protein
MWVPLVRAPTVTSEIACKFRGKFELLYYPREPHHLKKWLFLKYLQNQGSIKKEKLTTLKKMHIS